MIEALTRQMHRYAVQLRRRQSMGREGIRLIIPIQLNLLFDMQDWRNEAQRGDDAKRKVEGTIDTVE